MKILRLCLGSHPVHHSTGDERVPSYCQICLPEAQLDPHHRLQLGASCTSPHWLQSQAYASPWLWHFPGAASAECKSLLSHCSLPQNVCCNQTRLLHISLCIPEPTRSSLLSPYQKYPPSNSQLYLSKPNSVPTSTPKSGLITVIIMMAHVS